MATQFVIIAYPSYSFLQNTCPIQPALVQRFKFGSLAYGKKFVGVSIILSRTYTEGYISISITQTYCRQNCNEVLKNGSEKKHCLHRGSNHKCSAWESCAECTVTRDALSTSGT